MTIPLLRRCDAFADKDRGLTIVVKSCLEADLLREIPWKTSVDILAFERKHRLSDVIHILRLGRALRSRDIDLLLVAHGTDRPWLSFWSRYIGAARSVGPAGRFASLGFDRGISTRVGEHKVFHFLRFADEVGVGKSEAEPGVTVLLSDAARSFASSRLPEVESLQWIVFAPGSGTVESHKRWPSGKFAELGRMVLDLPMDIGVILFGSAQEENLLREILEEIDCKADRCVVVTERDIGNALAVLRRCTCMVAGCSGAAHMAASVGIPIVGIFGPTNPGFTGPFTRKLRVVRRGLACSPCYRKDFIQGCGNPVCMTEVDTGDVFREVVNILKDVPYPPVSWFPTTTATRPEPA
jgi:ADP-heptose:LPS heptosyltransferase